ncbi:MAG: hypothetical protein J0H68_05140 [Sphingobacteriia bacterium]|nr:hypothetical protein [Sphingobacteriia bacterium]
MKSKSNSINDFINFLKSYPQRYFKETEGFIWKTSNKELLKLIENSLNDINKVFDINSPIIESPKKVHKVNIISSSDANHKNSKKHFDIFAGGISAL